MKAMTAEQAARSYERKLAQDIDNGRAFERGDNWVYALIALPAVFAFLMACALGRDLLRLLAH